MAAHPPQAKKSLIQEFKEFLNQGDFVTIAVGLIIALYFKSIVDAILAGVILPIIAAIFGKPDFSSLRFTLHHSTFPAYQIIPRFPTPGRPH